MDVREFSYQFDVLYNNISSNRAPSLNSYDKAVFLTQSQNALVKNYFFTSGEGLKGFDGNQKRQIDFSFLITDGDATYNTSTSGLFDPRALVFDLPERVLFIVNEAVYFTKYTPNVMRQVIPISYDEYTRLMQKPYKEPLKNQAWRLFVQKNNDYHKADLILNSADIADYIGNSLDNIDDKLRYAVRYVRRPKPIILEDLKVYGVDGEDKPLLTIDGKHEVTECELDPSVHEEILQKAVEMAKAAWG